MQNQVLSIKQMQELKELGIDTSKASCEWMHTQEYGWTFIQAGKGMYSDMEYISTFTLQDILEMLPKGWTLETYPECRFIFTILTDNCYMHEEKSNCLLEAAFNMLKWCKQNNFI